MEWLNLKVSTIRQPEYVGSDPVQRATWFNVLVYCVEQENEGRILGGALWGDRQWQQTCGVTAKEVAKTTLLLVREGDDVLVFCFPQQHVEALNKKRHGAAITNAKRWGARPPATVSTAPTESLSDSLSDIAPPVAPSSLSASHSESIIEGKVKKGNSKVREGERPSSQSDLLAYASQIGMPTNQAEAFFDHFEANGWRQGGKTPIKSWQAAARTWHRRASEFGKKSFGSPAANVEPFDPSKPFAHTGGYRVV